MISFHFQIVFMIFTLQYLILKIDSYQKFDVPTPTLPDFNIHSVYNIASNTLKDIMQGSVSTVLCKCLHIYYTCHTLQMFISIIKM